MKIVTLVLVVFVILSTSFPAAIKAEDTGDTGNVGVTCDARQLQPCLAAITGGGQPSGACCAKLTEQQSCLCGFAKNPAFAQYISSPNARKVLLACNVAYPTC
ncbi:putative bifunctional inhibitor/plant lipid transfer protein/seed storage helical [Arabidopsis thaliana]|uniref:At1g66850 n=3 Tax=Arabidopsis TaxID=3701 RepID=Q9C9N7_ARATH|nr:Bifunctional inhibitor/lipid-transfer protein/seed storage 2S albumin superfamily protein [Arabidopsis thaliana]KAG7650797.1 Bifunctional inhibitor/plant lipid transfer protein/seed storage helical domain [Arabidopsis thaliana x Arabidopsis arenosa]AAG60074.1 lipid transfer protein, putative [Arabidopsis thaliana]AAM63437.1 lipid transfer protein, putative [Arabidopsis thaliana]AAO42934.1 At1g66850 [Arabidopsis thaliana]AEE34562.1 Bifunctional inhibitor/lipid-transfer protein/seed storage 2|eukprot:NP_176857.1 Bifunctional inhibitor/lipid-transfer protein/seed storage 2S albumin superfamily protein [Arabidopsis thaliana]